MLFWLSSQGFVGYGSVTGTPFHPESHDEVPWPGGLYRWAVLIPITIEYECPKPVKLGFVDGRMELTGISSFALRRGFVPISDQAGEAALKSMMNVGQP